MLTKGNQYEVGGLVFIRWTRRDHGVFVEVPYDATDGRDWRDYFTADGTYLGPGNDGIEPIFE
jgi:hypothetical protein